jgi:hypothetical protein
MESINRKMPNTAVVVFCALLCLPLTASKLQAQNGITATQVAGSSTGAGSGVDAMWADNTDQRWKMNNNNTGAQDVAAWACFSNLGGIMYAGALVSGVNAESCLSLNSDAGVPLLAGSSAPQWGGTSTYLNLQQNALVSEFTNNSAGTTAGLLVIFVTSGSSSQVKTALTSTTQGVVGICVAGCSTSGTVQIAREGVASCAFDGSTTAGHYVQISTTAGKCHDTGSINFPTNGNQVIGRVLSSQSIGTWPMMLYPDGIVPPNQGNACSNKVVTALDNVNGPTCTTITSAYVDSTVLTGAHYAPIPASDSISAAGSFATTQSISNTGLKAGSIIIARAHGRYTTTGTSSPVINLEINAGGTTGICPAANANIGPNINTTNGYWETECFMSIQTTGTPGTASVWGKWGTSGTVQAQLTGKVFGQTANQNYTTTSAQTLSVQETATFVTGQTMILDALDIQVTY